MWRNGGRKFVALSVIFFAILENTFIFLSISLHCYFILFPFFLLFISFCPVHSFDIDFVSSGIMVLIRSQVKNLTNMVYKNS